MGKNLGKQILQLREAAELSQSKLAENADVSKSFISKLEAGEYNTLSLDVCQQLSKALGLTLKDFLSDLGFLEREETKDMTMALQGALRSGGFTPKQSKAVLNYAELIRKAGE